VALARAVTLVESTLPAHRAAADTLVALCSTITHETRRIAISGVPGVGKSTFIDAFGSLLTSAGERVAVLAIDPSSEMGGGSILGDKTRMERLAIDPLAFVRPSPSGGNLGGVARSTRETILLCEAAGYTTTLIETVGVGQSETMAHGMTDMFVLLVLAGAGDELQGIKRGIMEMADMVVINKDDGSQAPLTGPARGSYTNALHLFPARPDDWVVPVTACSSVEGRGITDVAAEVERFFVHMRTNGGLAARRRAQSLHWFDAQLHEGILEAILIDPNLSPLFASLREAVRNGSAEVPEAIGRAIAALHQRLG
jgi:LAO/AO transport system kinase